MFEVKVPKLGEEMTETQLIEWVAKEGEKIKENDIDFQDQMFKVFINQVLNI